MKTRYRLIIGLLAGLSSLTSLAAVNASLEPGRVADGETVQLTLQHDGRTSSEPDLTPLKNDFDILGRSTGSSIQIVNGSMSMHVQVRLTLSPKHTGKIQVPSLLWDGEHTPVLDLMVDAGGTPRAGGNTSGPATQHVFMQSSVDQKQPYLQSAVTLTVRLFTDQPLYQASLDLPASSDVIVQPVGKDQSHSETHQGHTYQVIERKYLVFPQRSGQINLAGPVFDGLVADDSAAGSNGMDPMFGNVFGQMPFANMMARPRPVRLHDAPIVLNVRPRPAASTGRDWLPAQQVTLTENWQPDTLTTRVGEPITRHLTLRADGLTAAQLPDPGTQMIAPDGLRIYPDPAKLDTTVASDTAHATREQDIAYIASRSGRFVLPAVHVTWWDTRHAQQREAVLPSHTLTVLAGAATTTTQVNGTPPPASPAPSPAPPTITSRYDLPSLSVQAWSSIGLGLLGVSGLALWWQRRHLHASRPAPSTGTTFTGSATSDSAPINIATPGIAAARKAFQTACHDNDPHAARRSLLDWARAAWPNDPPAGLNAIANHLDTPDVQPLLRQLDRACYAGGDWQGAALAQALKDLPVAAPPAKTPGDLASLYP